MTYLTIILNSIIVFLLSNNYIINKGYNIKIPMILLILLFIIINILPSILCKKLYDKKLNKIRNGYRLLIIFFVNLILSTFIYIISIIKYNIDFKILLINLLLIILVLTIVFWNGIIRVYLFSKQLGIRYRFIGLLLGLVPIINLIMLVKIIKICKNEVDFENNKIKTNIERKNKEICKTKYPLLLVHGIFFRDFEHLNYWGRIPNELINNGATIYYGNHSSSLSVKESAKEIAERIKEIIKETNCEKVNVIAHSKGGLDTRYAISNLGMDKYIASLTMINTPNHGCVFADYLLNKAPNSLKNTVASSYNFALKKLGDKEPNFLEGVSDLTSTKVEELNKIIKKSDKVYYQAFGSVLKKTTGGRFPLNLTNNFVKYFDGKNDGLVGEDSFPIYDNFTLVEAPKNRGISHGDVIDLNRENIEGYDVREFYVKLVNDLKNKGY